MRQLRVDVDGETTLEDITFSFGISSLVPTEDMWSKTSLMQADKALYQAKENGRDTFVVYQEHENDTM